MIGTLDQERMRSITSEPSMSGSPRSTRITSIGRNVAERIASAPVAASCTTKPLTSKPVRRKRRIWISSSTTSTMGECSFIFFAFHVRDGGLRHRQFDGGGRSEIGSRADGAHAAAVGRDKGIGDPQPEAGAADRGVAFAAHEAAPHLRLFGFGEAGAFVADADREVTVDRARRGRDARAG